MPKVDRSGTEKRTEDTQDTGIRIEEKGKGNNRAAEPQRSEEQRLRCRSIEAFEVRSVKAPISSDDLLSLDFGVGSYQEITQDMLTEPQNPVTGFTNYRLRVRTGWADDHIFFLVQISGPSSARLKKSLFIRAYHLYSCVTEEVQQVIERHELRGQFGEYHLTNDHFLVRR